MLTAAVPRCLRVDGGTENVMIEDIQKSFRDDGVDEMAGQRSVIIGSSNHNQVGISVLFVYNMESLQIIVK